jgi:hypothetical protein
MEYIDYINEFFSHVKCAQCHEFFKDDSIQLVRQESNNIVVRITCSKCGKNLGLAILGIDRAEHKNSLEFSKNTAQNTDMPISINADESPITYDDVAEAHQFFSSLGDDWSKHLPKFE